MTVLDHLWQSSLVAILAYCLTLLFRNNSASIRYWLWFAASVKFLLPFSFLAALGRVAFVHTIPAESMAVLTKIEPAAMPFSAVAPPTEHLPWLGILAAVWLLGLVAILSVWLVRWRRLSAAARSARALAFDLPVPVRSTQLALEPGLVGIWRPVILLPEGIVSHLSRTEIDAILNHELCHLRRRDNLLAMVHMLVAAVFWFHPLVWFIGTRLVEEREQACDEGVLAGGQNPLEYAQTILRVCRLYLRSPLACASGVAGADLDRRVEAIMARPDLEDVNTLRKLMLAGLLLIAIAGPLATGGLRAAPPAELMRRLATALLPPEPAVTTVAAALPKTTRHRAHPTVHVEPVLKVEARTLREREVTATPSLIVIAAPQLPAEPQEEAKMCRAPQQLSGSRLLGPEVCLTQGEWDQLAKRNLVLMPDGQTLAAIYEKERSKAAGGCAPQSHVAIMSNNVYPGYCF